MQLKDLFSSKGFKFLDLLFGIILIQFIFAWDALDRVTTLPYTGFLVNNYFPSDRSHIISYLIDIVFQAGDQFLSSHSITLRPAYPVFYWGWFLIQEIFILLLLLVGYKLQMKKGPLYVTILTMAILRYGYWDYFMRPQDGITYIIMLLMYYSYKTGNKKVYYLLTVVGVLQREFCLFVNLFVVLDQWKGIKYSAKNIFTKEFFSKIWPELMAMGVYIIYRFLFLKISGFSETGLSPSVLQYSDPIGYLTNPKEIFHVLLFLGWLWYFLLKSKDLRLYLLVIAIFVFSVIFAFPYEINKVGSVFFIVHFEIADFKKKDKNLVRNEQIPPVEQNLPQ